MFRRLINKLNSKKGYSMTELLTVVAILSVLTIAVAVMVSASSTTYRNSLLISESSNVENMVNTALSEQLRYAEAIQTDENNNITGIKISNIPYSISTSSEGYLVQTNRNTNASSALLNKGSYAGMHVEDFTIKYSNSVFTCSYRLAEKNGGYKTDPISYTIRSAFFMPDVSESWQPGMDLPSPSIEIPPEPPQANYRVLTIIYKNGSKVIARSVERVPIGETKEIDIALEGYTCNPSHISVKLDYDVTRIVSCMLKEYTIKYDLAGGTLDVHNPTAYSIETDTFTVNNPKKNGSSFIGWSGTDIPEGTYAQTITIEKGSIGDRAYTANWTAGHFTVRFNGNGATSGSMADQEFTYGTAQNLRKNTFKKDNYTFGGWSRVQNDHASYNDQQNVRDLSPDDNAIIDLYAVWTYQVKFDKNDPNAIGEMDNQTFVHNLNGGNRLNANTFTKTGYLFAGWATSPTGSIVYTDRQSGIATIPNVTNSSVTLYAKWTPVHYSVKFNANGGTGTMSNQSFAYDTAQNLTPNSFTRTGYSFLGWATSSTGDVVYSDRQSVINLSETDGATVNLYAKWSREDYTITYNLDGGTATGSNPTTYNVDTPTFTLSNPTRNGYMFKGWTGTNGNTPQTTVTITKGSTGNRSYKANWAKLYRVQFIVDGIVKYDDYHAEGTSVPILSKPSGTFNGWNFSPSVSQSGNSFTMPSSDVTAAGVLRHTVTFNTRGFAKFLPWDNTTTRTIYYSQKYSQAVGTGSYNGLPEYFVNTSSGCTFDGWYTAPVGGEKVTGDTVFYGSDDNTVLYAHYKFTVSIERNTRLYGSVSPSSVTLVQDTVITVDGRTLKANGSVIATASPNSGRSFDGWKNYNSGDTVTVSEPMTFTAQFSR